MLGMKRVPLADRPDPVAAGVGLLVWDRLTRPEGGLLLNAAIVAGAMAGGAIIYRSLKWAPSAGGKPGWEGLNGAAPPHTPSHRVAAMAPVQ